MPLGLSFIGILYGATLISPCDLGAYRYIQGHTAYTFYVVKHTCPRYSRSPNLPPTSSGPFSVLPTVHQTRANILTRNWFLKILNGQSHDGTKRERERVDEHVFLRKHRKSANRFREGDLFARKKKSRKGFPKRCRTYAVRGKRPITQAKSPR